MPLNDRARIILFWFTIALMLGVAILAAVTILRACGGLPIRISPPPTITPAEVSLCPGNQQQFAVADDVDVSWEASGGTVTEEGLYTAGDSLGDYTVTASRLDSGEAAGAIVHIVSCTPTPTATPRPTALPTATRTPTPEPTATPSDNPDPQDDVGAYETGAAIESPPSGVDIAAASIGPDLQVALQGGEDAPEGLAGWREEGEALFWMSLYDAIPDPPSAYTNWLFVLDVDNDTETGRPVGSRRINPDLGDEVALGVSYDANTQTYGEYCLVWDTENEQWTEGPELRYTFGESRSVVGLAVSLEALEEAIAQIGAASLTPESATGRAAAESYLADGTRVIDFYPNLPE